MVDAICTSNLSAVILIFSFRVTRRLQNRESAVRSRMKKRQEMEILEEQVRKLQEQKAAIESANEELKRQNKYWEDLFAKQ